ncbi:MAG: hypothetical protein WCD11_31910 [Solirubrobacteraceae bacterium]
MFNLSKRILLAAVVALAASAPSSAYATINNGGGGPASAPTTSASVKLTPYQQRQLADHPQIAAKELKNTPVAPAGQVAQTRGSAGQTAANSFSWGDAGIGAAGALALLSFGSGAILARRRRTHDPLAS